MRQFLFGFLTLVGVFAVGCGPRARLHGDGVIVAVVGKPSSLSPILDRGLPARTVQGALFRGLVQFGADGTRAAAWAAAVPSRAAGTFHALGANLTEWFFELRPGACWSDGAPLSMQDFMFAHTMAVYPPLKALHESWTSLVRGYTVSAAGRLRLVVLRSPRVDPLDLFPLPAHLLSAGSVPFESLPWHDAPVGCGPFAITAVRSGSVRMARNPKFQPRPARLGRLEIDWYGTFDDALEDVEKGAVDVVADVPIERAARWHPTGGVTLLRTPSPALVMLVFNTRDLAMRHEPVRQAIVCAVDRRALCEAVGGSVALPTSSWLPPTHAAYVPAFDSYRGGVDAARKILAQSGWRAAPDGSLRRGREKHAVSLLVPTGRADLARAATALQQAWQPLGVHAAIEAKPPEIFQTRLQHRDFVMALEQIAVLPWTEPATCFAEESVPTNRNKFRGDNVSGWFSDAMQSRLSVVAAAPEPASAAASLKQQQILLAQAAPVLPLYFVPQVTAVRGDLEGVNPRGWGEITWNVEDWHWR